MNIIKYHIVFIFSVCIAAYAPAREAGGFDGGDSDPALLELHKRIASDPDAKKTIQWLDPESLQPRPPPPLIRSKGISSGEPDRFWGWKRMHGDKAPKVSPHIIIAIIDSGVDLTHPALKDSILDSYNAIEPGKPATDEIGHGTHVAGIIAAQRTEHSAGLAPGIKLVVAKVLDKTGSGSNEYVADGILWALRKKADIICISFATNSEKQPQAIKDAIDHAVNVLGKIVVCAAGNSGKSKNPAVQFPANLPYVIAVSALDTAGEVAPFSSYGKRIDFTAPGDGITSTYPESKYRMLSGTSMAAPHVAAAIAMAMDAGKTKSQDTVMRILKNACIKVNPNRDGPEKQGNGLILVDKIKPLEKPPPARQ